MCKAFHRAFFVALSLVIRRASTSLLARVLLALIICAMFRYCFRIMTGPETTARIHGTVLSILFALASSIAAALQGFGRMLLGTFGEPGWAEVASPVGAKSEGERYGEENDSKYSAMKKSSFRAQTVKSTVRLV